MKKFNITKERFEKSRYFQKKYGKLEYVSESGNLYKTDKGKVLKFVKESSVEIPDDAIEVIADRAIELLESLGRSKNVIMYLIDPERTAVGGENTSELRNMVENRLWDWIEGEMPRNGNADYTLTELYEMIKSGEL